MKILKSYRKLLLCVMIGVLILGSLLFWYCTPQLLQAFKASWLFLGVAIAIIATPLGNCRLSPPSERAPPRYRWLPWWGFIVLFELCLTAIFWGVSELNGHLLPILTKPHDALFINSLQESLLHMGLFPWVLYALFAVGFAHTAYVQQRNAYTCSLVSPFVKLSPSELGGLIFNVASRIVMLCTFISTLVFISLLLANALGHESLVNVVGLHATSMAAVFIILFLLINKRVKQYLHLLIIKKNLPVSLVIYSFIIAVAFFLLILGTLLQSLSHNIIAIPAPIRALLSKGWDVNWQFFSLMWWWGWAPVMGLFLARLSRGHTIRATLIAILALPFLVSVALYLCLQHHITIPLTLDSPQLAAIIPLLGFLILTLVILRPKTMGIVSELYLPKDDRVRQRAPDNSVRRWLTGTSIIYYIYLPTGIITLGIFFFLSTVVFSVLTLIISIALLKGLRRH